MPPSDDTGSPRQISDPPRRFLAQSAPSTFVSYDRATRRYTKRALHKGVSINPYLKYVMNLLVIKKKKDEKGQLENWLSQLLVVPR